MTLTLTLTEDFDIFADGHLQNCYFQLTACRDVVVVAAAAAAAAAVVVEVKALPVKNLLCSEILVSIRN